MACRGDFYALLPDESASLLACNDLRQRLDFLNDIYPSASADGRLQPVDKTWDAMHRVLCDGWLDMEHGDEAMRACVIGGRQLSDSNDYIISYVEPAFVKRIASAISLLAREWFYEQYFALHKNPPGIFAFRYECELTEEDCEVTWEYFTEVRELYLRASQRGLVTVFMVDQ